MKDVQTILKALTCEEDGIVHALPCLDIVFYWSGIVFERSEGILKAYQQCLDVHQRSFAFFRTETMSKATRLKQDTLELLPFWLKKTPTKRDIYMLFLENGSKGVEPSDRAFAFSATPNNGYLRLILPISFISESPKIYLELAKTLGQTFPYDFGQAGYSMNWNDISEDENEILRFFSSLANRYPGLDLPYPLITSTISSKGIKCVNWLTFLNRTYCDQLGGAAALKRKLAGDVIVHDLENIGCMIQAGPAPQIGDVNRQETLPIYHQVGKVLEPIRCKTHPPIFGPDGIGDEEITEKWLSRFDS